MVDGFMTSKDKLEFREIVLQHLKKLLDVSLRMVTQNHEKIRAYNDGVKSFSDILLPFYDKDMDKQYEIYSKNVAKLNEEQMKNYVIKQKAIFYSKGKEIHRELFRQLNLLMKRVDYLKASVYGESTEEEEFLDIDKK